MQISALDQSPIFINSTPQQALAETLELAQHCDRLGYARFWVAEHHGSVSFAGCAPETLMPHLASATSHIRIGSGGVMLLHYSPYKVAEHFRLLEALHPGRIDLGLGRAPGGDPWQAGALAYGSPTTTVDYFNRKVADLQLFLRGKPPATEAFSQVLVTPNLGAMPQTWMLVSSPDGARNAAQAGMAMALAHFIEPSCLELGELYRKEFQPSEEWQQPRVSLATVALASDSQTEAARLATSTALWRRRVQSGRFLGFPSVAEAQQEGVTAQSVLKQDDERITLGDAAQVAQQLHDLAKTAGADELMLVTICEHQHRLHSYSLLAETMGLQQN